MTCLTPTGPVLAWPAWVFSLSWSRRSTAECKSPSVPRSCAAMSSALTTAGWPENTAVRRLLSLLLHALALLDIGGECVEMATHLGSFATDACGGVGVVVVAAWIENGVVLPAQR